MRTSHNAQRVRPRAVTTARQSPARTGSWPALLAAVVLALLVGVPSVDAQEAETIQARGIDRVCPPPEQVTDDVDEPELTDIGPPHDEAIVCATGYELVSGFDDGTFRPGEPITRSQMATFVAAWIEVATDLELEVSDDAPTFSDVGSDDVHATAITALADAGIVGGRPDGTFGPDDPLTRGQFTRVVVNAISYADVLATGGPLPPSADAVVFTDVPGTTFEDEISTLAAVGVASGDADGAFHPDRSVTRGQLATFLLRAADYLDRHQRWEPTATLATLVAELDWREVVADDDGTDDDGSGDATTGGQEGATGTATLTLHAFNGTLAYTLEVSDVDGPFGTQGGATVHVGDAGSVGPVALQLADGAALDDAQDGFVQGVVYESDSEVRFADLLAAPDEAYVLIATDEHPDGAVRGQLHLADPS